MYKIMLADDEGIVIDALKFIIEKEFGSQCEIEYAKTGRSVIELAEHFRPDIAFMDIRMPGINGIDAMREIRKTNSNTQFIVMSAYDKFDYAKESINLGVLDYLNKPVEKNKIINVLKRAMEIIDNERESRRRELQIKEKMETVVPIIENGFVYSLLFQELGEEEILNFKNLLDIEGEHCYIGVLLFGEEQVGSHMTNAIGTSVRVQRCYNEVRESIKEKFNCYLSSVMSNEIILVIPEVSDKLEYNDRIVTIEKTRELIKELRKSVDIHFRMGYGAIVPLNEAAKSYQDAKLALAQIDSSVAHIDDVQIGCDYEDNYPLDVENSIFEFTQRGKVEAQRVEVEKFFKWMIDNYSDSKMDIKIKVLEFVLRAEQISYEGSSRTYKFQSRQDYLPTIMAMDDMELLRNWFIDKMVEAVRIVASNKEVTSSDAVARAKEYMNANFKKDITLDDVSREVDISPYYFSKLFKESTGENFIEYLTQIRIEKAKELLTNPRISIKEVCAEVGYADPNYFSRAFKKNVGVTPTEYKEENS